MLKSRLITASILIALVASLLFYFPPTAWLCFTSLITALAAWEWFGLLPLKTKQPAWRAVVFAAALTVATQLASYFLTDNTLLAALICTLWASVAILRYATNTNKPASGFSHPLPHALCGLIFLSAVLISVQEVFLAPQGSWVLLAAMSVIWVNDSMAYFTGKTLGKHKLIPAVSPNKTWEGFIGGLVFATIWGYITGKLLWPNMPHPYAFILLILLLALTANVGDLFMSVLKRLANKKDTSQLLPGHGGILDRIDSLLTGLPLFLLGCHILGLISH